MMKTKPQTPIYGMTKEAEEILKIEQEKEKQQKDRFVLETSGLNE